MQMRRPNLRESFFLWTVRLTIEGGPEWVRTAQFGGGRIVR
jgi:hypothetical protein